VKEMKEENAGNKVDQFKKIYICDRENLVRDSLIHLEPVEILYRIGVMSSYI